MSTHSVPHVLDLPSLYTRPSASILLDTLNALQIRPSTFDRPYEGEGSDHDFTRLENSLPRYLTDIVANSLSWIEDDSLKEQIWEAASMRVSERSGRSAMPSVSRTFHIPVSPDPSTVKLSIVLREPSLTGDNLGHKTWAASYLLAKRLNLLLPLLPIVPQPSTPVVQLGSFGVSETALHKDGGAQVSAPRVLELGAGTGLVGIAAAAVCATHVDLTDLPEICGNLEKNCQANSTTVKAYGGSLSVFPLDWSDLRSGDSVPADNKYDIILAADPLYSPQHPKLLADTISSYLNLESSSRVVVELPLRDAYQVEIEAFRSLMTQRGLQLLSEGGEIGYDDWEDGTGEVKCWWGIWGWEKVAQAG